MTKCRRLIHLLQQVGILPQFSPLWAWSSWQGAPAESRQGSELTGKCPPTRQHVNLYLKGPKREIFTCDIFLRPFSLTASLFNSYCQFSFTDLNWRITYNIQTCIMGNSAEPSFVLSKFLAVKFWLWRPTQTYFNQRIAHLPGRLSSTVHNLLKDYWNSGKVTFFLFFFGAYKNSCY